ncbi:MAG TPA: hypothetical protein VFY87_29555 [Geminicoccaceae bacterium]|nr:hypothetical protein [Geminicoccaceae bacterium]
MALSIRDPETDRLARISCAREEERRRLVEDVRAIQEWVAGLTVLDGRAADEMLGYDRHGLPT